MYSVTVRQRVNCVQVSGFRCCLVFVTLARFNKTPLSVVAQLTRSFVGRGGKRSFSLSARWNDASVLHQRCYGNPFEDKVVAWTLSPV